MALSVPRSKKFLAELFGTFWLVLGGCGSAVLAAVFPYDSAAANPLGLGFLGVSLAFGLTLLTMAYAIGHISGCHIIPAVSFGLWAGGRFPGSQLVPYIVAQVLGAVIAGGVIYLVASGRDGFALAGSNPLATNGFGAHSPGGYGLFAAVSYDEGKTWPDRRLITPGGPAREVNTINRGTYTASQNSFNIAFNLRF